MRLRKGEGAALAAAAWLLAGAPATADPSGTLWGAPASDEAAARALTAPAIRPLGAHDDANPGVDRIAPPPPNTLPPAMPQAVDIGWRVQAGPRSGALVGWMPLGPGVPGAAVPAPLGQIRVTAVATDLSGQSAEVWRGALAGMGAGRLDPRLARQTLPGGAVSVTAAGASVTLKHDRDAGTLRLHAPALGLSLVGAARTVGEADRLLRRWLAAPGVRDRLTRQVLRRSIAATPDDPLAGNRDSLLHAFTRLPMPPGAPWAGGGVTTAVQPHWRGAPSSFYAAPTQVAWGRFPGTHSPQPHAGPAFAGVGIGVEAGRPLAPADGVSVPLTLHVPLGGGVTASFAAPLSWSRGADGAERAAAGLSLGLTAQVAPGWRMGAMLHGGAAGETGRSLGALTGVSAVSAYDVEAGGARISLLNSVTAMQSAPLDWNGRRHDAELAGMALRNGVAVDWAAPGFGHAAGRWGVEAADWRWVGTDLHQSRTLEAGLAWRGRDDRGRERTALRFSGLVGDGEGSALRAALDLRF